MKIKLRKIINQRLFYAPLVMCGAIYLYYTIIHKTSDAFKGAFFGFIVGIATFLFVKYMEMKTRRYNILVYLEHELNASINDLMDNKFQIDKILESDTLTLLSPCELRLTGEHIKHIGRKELKNDIFSLYADFKKYNHSIKMSIDVFERNINNFKEFTIQHKDAPDVIETLLQQCHQGFKTHLKELNEFGDMVFEDLKMCIVKIRFFAKVDKTLLASNICQSYYEKEEFESWLVEDKKRLEAEMEETARKDKARRDKRKPL